MTFHEPKHNFGVAPVSMTYRQLKPNPYAVVAREDLHIHLFGIDGFDPEQSYGTVIVEAPDPDALYQAFAAGMRAAYGKLPVKGIPRITRPRKRWGTVYGFSVVDVGGNWLRVTKTRETRFADAPAVDRARALLYRAELAVRVGDGELARSSLAEVRSMTLNKDEQAAIADDLAHASELVGESQRRTCSLRKSHKVQPWLR